MSRRSNSNDQNPEGVPGDDSSGTPGSGGRPDDPNLMSAEGPDVELPTGGDDGFSAEDQAFLADLATGSAPSAESEHLADLRRVTAEYANYRKRVDRERVVERERAVGDAARVVLPVLDDLDRAEKHGDLAEGGPLTTIAQKLRGQVAKLGLVPFGEKGEVFDPRLHDAIFQRPSADVQRDTVSDVVERGYRIGDTVLRVAKVVVDTPGS